MLRDLTLARTLFRGASAARGPLRPAVSWLLLAAPPRRSGRALHGSLAIARIVGLWSAGKQEQARRLAIQTGDTATNDGLRLAVADLLLRIDAPKPALELARGIDVDAGGRERARATLYLRAQAATATGRYAAAHAALGAVRHGWPTDRGADGLYARLDALENRFAPQRAIVRPRPAGSSASVPGRSLLLVQESLEDVQSGYTVRTRDIVAAQRTAGLDPHVLVSKPVGRRPDEERQKTLDGTPFTWLPERPDDANSAADAHAELAAELAERLRPAVIHPATPFRLGRLGLQLARWLDVPAVYEVRGFREETWLATEDETDDADHYLLTRRADTEVMRAADAVVTLGEGMKADLVARGVDAARIAVIPNAVDTQRFQPGPRHRELAARFAIDEDQVVIGYISSFEAYEDFGTLVDAIGRLRDRGRRVRGLLIGDGPTRAAVARHVHEAGLADVVELPGRIPNAEISGYYQLMDIFVVPRIDSRVSALVTPLKPMEAMASGSAIVVSRLPALMEPIQDGITGLSFAVGDAHDLAEVLDPLVTDAGMRRKLGAAAREWILAERTLERNGQRYRQLYAQVGVELAPST